MGLVWDASKSFEFWDSHALFSALYDLFPVSYSACLSVCLGMLILTAKPSGFFVTILHFHHKIALDMCIRKCMTCRIFTLVLSDLLIHERFLDSGMAGGLKHFIETKASVVNVSDMGHTGIFFQIFPNHKNLSSVEIVSSFYSILSD